MTQHNNHFIQLINKLIEKTQLKIINILNTIYKA